MTPETADKQFKSDLEKLRAIANEDRAVVLNPIRAHAMAIVSREGSAIWLNENRVPHRTHVFGLPIDAPAVIKLNGDREYYSNGQFWRRNNRAPIVRASGVREWVVGSWRDEKPRHQGPIMACGVPGPAIVYPDGLVIYVDLEGKYLMEDQWTPKEAADYFK